MMDNTVPFAIETIVSDDVDTLVVEGIRYINAHGTRIQVNAGSGLQAYGVNYVLLDSRQRVHNLRYPESLRYLCRELLAFFQGSRNVRHGLAQASAFWNKLADESGTVQSNYGYYVFHQRANGITQYDWIVSNLKRNLQSRKALCNINQSEHKNPSTRDFPCAIAAQFMVRDGYVCCEVFSRSEDVITGLPYDLGFFSFVNEIVCADLNRSLERPIKLGYTMIRCSFTQIYDRTLSQAQRVMARSLETIVPVYMPAIKDVEETLKDIYGGTRNSNIVRWIFDNASIKPHE